MGTNVYEDMNESKGTKYHVWYKGFLYTRYEDSLTDRVVSKQRPYGSKRWNPPPAFSVLMCSG